ncbi:Probable replication-associated protein RepA1 (plasmid) [Buchnera aphidicola (Tetraneura ulmi)]|uniref:plasmid replication initiator RepA n=1 Tax=Buchnera aphidicola TaxID=9 RepID=UPI0034646028
MKKIKKKYVSNYMPKFKIPKKNKNRPNFIQNSMKLANEIDVARVELHYVIQPKNPQTGEIIKRYRRLNEHRACAFRAMVQAMLYYFNLSTNTVYASLEKLSDDCGLSTISPAGNKSISRASRLISKFMEPMGFLKSEKKWDNILGTYMPKIFILTPLFFELFGVTSKQLSKAKKQQLNWINNSLKKKGIKPLTEEKIYIKNKNLRIQKILEFRKSQHNFYIRQKRAKKIISNNEFQAKQKILKLLVKNYSLNELQKMGQGGLKKMVNIEYFHLKKIATMCFSKNTVLNK